MVEISLCRLCQNDKGVYCLKKEKTLLNHVEKYIQLKVSDDPVVFPNLLCLSCKIKISDFHAFVLHCHKINEQLQNTIEIVKLDKELSPSLFDTTKEDDKSNHDLLLKIDDVKLESDTDDETYEETVYLEDTDVEVNIKPQHCREKKSIKEEPSLEEIFNVNNENGKDSIIEYTLETHIADKNKEYTCKLCNVKFTVRHKLNKHIRTVHIKEKCSVEGCNKIYSFKHSLERHLLRDHQDMDLFLCSFCGKGTSSKHALKIHENIHKGIKDYPCKLCNQKFYYSLTLKAHIRNDHFNEKLFCSQCYRAFKSKSALKRHEIVHTGLKNFICEICSGAFFTNRELIVHKKTHSGIRPYKCSVCYKSFTQKHHIRDHERIHTGERPYPCLESTCKKRFINKQKLNIHMKSHKK